MSFKGKITAQCPKGCEPFETEIWSFIRGDKDPELRGLIIAGECNLLVCATCNALFFPEEPVVYFDLFSELLVFIFPESYRSREQYWIGKMREDFVAMKEAMGDKFPLEMEPQIFFGFEELIVILEEDDYRNEEQEVMEWVAKELCLEIYRVRPSYAREFKIPGALPYQAKSGAKATREGVIDGLQKVLAANDSLQSYRDWLKILQKPHSSLPPMFVPPGS